MKAPFVVSCLLALGCEAAVGDERPQWLVSMGTDAPIPELADRLLVEVLGEDGGVACTGCRRQFGLEPDAQGAGFPLSFAIVPPSSGKVRFRARLYRAARTGPDGLPTGNLLIDSIARLPELGAGITEVSLPLRMSCFGVAADEQARQSCEPTTGLLAEEPVLGNDTLPMAGSWAPAQPVPCGAAAPDGMVCVAGGVFLLGGDGFDGGASSLPERLVHLSPFFLDVDEVTVGTVRALVASGAISGEPEPKGPSATAEAGCTYGVSQQSDPFPVNCVSSELARTVCAALGKRLPTEAEWEFAAGNRALETSYPWGSDDDLCAHAILGRGRTPLTGPLTITSAEVWTCRKNGEPWGAIPGGGDGDVTALGVRNMGGNVAEWVDGELASYVDSCWGDGSLLENPVCLQPGGFSAGPAVRGGSWVDQPSTARAVTRRAWATIHQDSAKLAIGFRCAKSGL